MAEYNAQETLAAAGDEIRIGVPDDVGPNNVLMSVHGTYVGTIALESAGADKVFSGITHHDVDDGAAAIAADEEGDFAGSIAAAEKEVKVSFSAYTSGSAIVRLAIMREAVV